MDPLSIIASTIGIVGAIAQAYEVVKTISGLPKAFEEVNQQLPVVDRTLRAAKSRLRRDPDPTDEEEAAITSILKTCHDKATKLHQIFDELGKKRKGKGEAVSWEKIRSAYQKVLAGLKANRVEALMQEILKSIKMLALHQVFQAVTKEDLMEIEKAITRLSQVPPSLDDSEFDNTGISASMNVASGGKGQQNNVQGDDNTFNSGENVATGSGHTIYFDDPTSNPPDCVYSNLPPIRVPYFVGRTALLEDIRLLFVHALEKPKSSTPTVAVITGIGGQGKSQTALQYCHQTSGYYAKFWINATTRETTQRSFEKIAAELSRKDRRGDVVTKPLTWEMVVREFANWKKRWLLVFDNHDDPVHFSGPDTTKDEKFSHLADFFPSSNRGSIIITTRDIRVGADFPNWKKFDVSAMNESEAMSLLRRFPSNGELSEDELAAGKDIVQMLGYLPLAISQTSWFISNYAKGFREYLKHFNEFKTSAIKKMPERSLWSYQRDDKAENWFTTYEHSLISLSENIREAATSLLTLSAFFGDAAIHEEFFKHYCSKKPYVDDADPEWLSLFGVSKDWDLMAYRGCITELANRSLIQFQRDEQPVSDGFQYSLHPVIREWLLIRIDPSAGDSPRHKDYASLAVAVLAAFVRGGNIYSMPLHQRLDVLTHINKFLDENIPCLYQGHDFDTSKDTIPPALSFAVFCRDFSRLNTAKVLLNNVLKVKAGAGISESNVNNGQILIELGETFSENAEHSVAEGYFTKALKHSKEIDDFLKCRALIGQVSSALAQGRFRASYPLAMKAMCLAETLGDDGRRLVVRAKLCVASAVLSLGNLDKASELFNGAFQLAKEHFGESDNLTLEAEILTYHGPNSRGKPDEAKKIISDTLRKIEKFNGLDHRLAVNALIWLGLIYGGQASHTRARECFELCKSRAHALWGDSPGDADIDLLIGSTYAAEDDLDRAKKIFDDGLRRSRGKEGYEMVFVRTTGCLLELHIRQRQFLKAIPYVGNFFLYFPFSFFLKTNKMPVLLGLGGCLLILDAARRGNVLGLALICAFIITVGRVL
ncbi:hypothetical protein QQZ08_005891 [Neonectria magnoliae]|uniref:NACHT-NTPase and P-loop NTPases N-terminal domain-containing protein n=1 Tax=Neonectria magnoliae TaxID=2732573 RepID=A0ABR1I2D1_9HYPO